jgi:hypothetical protein
MQLLQKSGNRSHNIKTPHRRRISKDTEPVLRNNLKPGQGAGMAHLVQRPCHRLGNGDSQFVCRVDAA